VVSKRSTLTHELANGSNESQAMLVAPPADLGSRDSAKIQIRKKRKRKMSFKFLQVVQSSTRITNGLIDTNN
jgi:hypothetical protein